MQLIELRIAKARYGNNEGKYVGHAEFGNKKGKVDIVLTPEHCENIFKVCADSILETAKEAASELTISVIEHQEKLEVKNK